MAMTIRGKGVPGGQYTAEFLGVDETEHEQYGPGLVWSWLVVGGEFDGQTIARTTSPEATGRNACGKLFKAVTGRPFTPGRDNDVEPYVGKRYALVVEDAPSGNGTRVVSAVQLPDDQQPRQRQPGEDDEPAVTQDVVDDGTPF